MSIRPLPVTFMNQMADVLKVMGHGYRLRIVEFLDLHGPTPAHVLLAALGGAQGLLSQHLAKLRQAQVIQAERRGKEVWYTLDTPAATTILNCMRKRQGALQ
jgi:ArsR family transcriptional regulator